MAETTGVAELIVRVKDEATKQVQSLARVLRDTLDPDQWEEVKRAMEDLGVSIDETAENFDALNDAADESGEQTKKTSRQMNGFKDNLDDVSDAADAVGGSLGGVTSQASNLLGVLTRVNPLLAGVGIAIGSASLGVAAANNVGTYAKQLETLSVASNTTTQELQEFASAARTVGFDLEKSASVLTDLNDRFGDFISTNGGALNDYFETLGDNASYTAQELSELGTVEAIQAIQQDLEDNNVSVNQQIFLWESVAGEASKLIPILRDGGRELARLTAAARRRGEIFTDEEIQKALEFQRTVSEAGRALETLWRRIGIAVLPILESFVENVEDLTDTVEGINRLLANGESDWRAWGDAIGQVADYIGSFSATQQAIDAVADALNLASDAADDLGDSEADELASQLEAAERAAEGVSTKLEEAQRIEEYLAGLLAGNTLSATRRKQVTEDLASAQRLVARLTEEEQEAAATVLELKQQALDAQKDITDEIKKGNEETLNGKKNGEDDVKTISLGLQLLLNQAQAELSALATDTASTLQGRLQAAARQVSVTYAETLQQMKNQGGDTNLVEAIISQETAREQFAILETEFDRVGSRLEQQANQVGRQVQNGLISEEEGTNRLAAIYAATQTELDSLLAKMQSLATRTGSQEMAAALAGLVDETENLKQSLGDEGFIRPEWLDNMDNLRREVEQVKLSLTDFGDIDLSTLSDSTELAVAAAIRPLQDLKEELVKTFSGEELNTQTNLVDELIDVRTAETRLDALESLYRTRAQSLNTTLASISLQQEEGLLSEAEAAEQVRTAYARMRPELEEIVTKMQELGNESGIPSVQADVAQLQLAFEKLDAKVADASATIGEDLVNAGAEAAGSGFAQAITDIAQGAEDLGDVFDQVLKSILEGMLEVVQSAVAKQFTQILTNSILSGIGGGGAGGAAAGVVAAATGGYIRGPGTTTSDSIAARLSDREFVQPADATAYYGVQFMELLRRRAIPRELLMALMGGKKVTPYTPRRAKFSSGGFVSGNVLSGTDSGAKGDLNVTLVQVRDEKEAQTYMRSKDGGEDVVRIISANKAQVKSLLNN